MDFAASEWALILTGALLIRLIPALMLVGGLLKLREFPDLRAVHLNLITSAALVVILSLIDTIWPEIIPTALRASFFWSFFWMFAIAWLAVAWVRSAFKTGLRPRWIEVATLACTAALGIAAMGFILPSFGAQ